jgi:hypothetical protein
MVPEPLRVALAVARIFEALGIPYLLGGALASAVLGLIKVQAERLDREYLTRWADTMGLTDLLRRAIAEAGLP